MSIDWVKSNDKSMKVVFWSVSRRICVDEDLALWLVDKWKRGEVVGDSVEEDFASDKGKFVENTV